ncbi:hypothetical protein K438DRAFT_1925041 [Mycena galopus ATCC 62051]|nr:hypothetical protein K438DRAFT_1925041 [Mycena galopus ATCC 62051]
MALARLSKIPLELQYLVSKELGPSDLLALSQVSTYWRAFVLSDKRWVEWFAGIISYSDETLEHCLTRFNIVEEFSKRKLVYICLRDSCAVCADYAPNLYLPYMKRLCENCLNDDEFTVLQFSAALAKYDLRERDLAGLLTLEWCDPKRSSKRTIKLVSESQVKKIAIRNWGSEATLQAHLENKKATARSVYREKSEDYRRAASTRDALQETGHLVAAETVVLSRTGRKIPKAFPAYPAILLPARPTDRKVVCFAPQPLMEVGSELVLDLDDSDNDKSEA